MQPTGFTQNTPAAHNTEVQASAMAPPASIPQPQCTASWASQGGIPQTQNPTAEISSRAAKLLDVSRHVSQESATIRQHVSPTTILHPVRHG